MRFLTIAGFDVRTHTSGQEFLEQWGAHPPDCLIVDVQMPDLNGFDVVERLRRSGGRMPVIMITASDDQSLQRRARAEGIDIFLLKPVDGESLLQEIRQAVARWRSAASERI